MSNVLQLAARQAALVREEEIDTATIHHELAREAAVESMVLLANDGTLPITAERTRRIGVVGRLAFQPRIQGIGSSQISPTRVDSAARALRELAKEDGHDLEAWETEYTEDGLTLDQLADLERFLSRQDVALIFAGQRASHDAEAWDRPSMSLAPADLELIDTAAAVATPFAVILVGGGQWRSARSLRTRTPS